MGGAGRLTYVAAIGRHKERMRWYLGEARKARLLGMPGAAGALLDDAASVRGMIIAIRRRLRP